LVSTIPSPQSTSVIVPAWYHIVPDVVWVVSIINGPGVGAGEPINPETLSQDTVFPSILLSHVPHTINLRFSSERVSASVCVSSQILHKSHTLSSIRVTFFVVGLYPRG